MVPSHRPTRRPPWQRRTPRTYAKQQVGSLYGEGVQQAAAAGTSVAQQAQPYLSTASALLGTPTSEMEVNDPSGIWMAWSHGGTGPGGVQTQQEWSKTLQTRSRLQVPGITNRREPGRRRRDWFAPTVRQAPVHGTQPPRPDSHTRQHLDMTFARLNASKE